MTNKSNKKIAIIGISGRFPAAENVKEFWDILYNKKNVISKNNCDEFHDQPINAGWYKQRDEFDASFFNISPQEALYLDPQHRFALEESYKALEDAGITLSDLNGKRCGIYYSSLPSDYGQLIIEDDSLNSYQNYAFFGNCASMIPGRLAYFYNTNGPTMYIDTACSSSLSLLHVAAASLLSEKVELCLVGASTVFCSNSFFNFTRSANIYSQDGQIRTFCKNANGFVGAESTVVIVLKSLQQSINDGDRIYGIIEACEVNHNGLTNGLASPSVSGQKLLMLDTYKTNNIDINKIGYLEAHGTGTSMGDEVELQVLNTVFNQRKNPLTIGSCKANIGHGLVVSGLISLIKCIGILQKNKIPAHYIANDTSLVSYPDNLTINTEIEDFPKDAEYIGICAYGFNGSNGHLIISSHKPEKYKYKGNESLLFCFSAKTDKSLRAYLGDFLQEIEGGKLQNAQMNDISYTLAIKRNHFKVRYACIADTIAMLRENIIGYLQDDFTQIHNVKNVVGKESEKERSVTLLNRYLQEYIQEEMPNLKGLFGADIYPIADLPTYHFDTKKYWPNVKKKAVLRPKVENKIKPIITTKKNGESAYNALEKIKNVVEVELGYPQQDLHPSLSIRELGIDSLVALKMMSAIGVEDKININQFFECETISDLIELIIEEKAVSSDCIAKMKTLLPNSLNFFTGRCDNLEYLEIGNADKILLLCGPLNTNYLVWIQQVRSLVKYFTIIIPSYPGHGGNSNADVGFQNIADSLEKLIFKKSNKPCFAAGWSLGGCLLQLLAAKNSSCFSHLVLINCSCEFDDDFFEKSINLRNEFKENQEFLANVFLTDHEPLDLISGSSDFNNLKDYYHEFSVFKSEFKLRKINCPVTVIYGENDSVISKDQIKKMATQIANHELIVLHKQGHFLPLTHGLEFNNLIMEKFLVHR